MVSSGLRHTMDGPAPLALISALTELQPISCLGSLCTNRTPCARQPLNGPSSEATSRAEQRTNGRNANTQKSVTKKIYIYFFYSSTKARTPAKRMDAAGRREPVCRSLFGPVDHEQLRRDLALNLREFAEQDSRRWNFNFQTETPLSGRFQWDEVPATAAAAAAVYRECARPTDGAWCSAAARDGVSEREDGAGKDQENRSSVSNTRRSCPAEATTAARRKRTLSRPAAKPGRNARITGEGTTTYFYIHNEGLVHAETPRGFNNNSKKCVQIVKYGQVSCVCIGDDLSLRGCRREES